MLFLCWQALADSCGPLRLTAHLLELSFAGPLSGTMVLHVHEVLGHTACCTVTLIHGNRSSSAIQCGLRTWGVLIKTHKLVKMTQVTAFHTTVSTLRKCSSLPHDPETLTTQNGKASALQELLGSPVMVSIQQSVTWRDV